MYSYVLYYYIEKSGFNVVSAYLLFSTGMNKDFILNSSFWFDFESVYKF